MNKFGWSDDILKFMLNQITDPRYLISWAEKHEVLSHILVLQRLQVLEGRKVSFLTIIYISFRLNMRQFINVNAIL